MKVSDITPQNPNRMQKLILTTTLLLFLTTAFSQTKEELQRQRQQLNNEIQETERILNETRKSTKENLGVLNVINKRLDLQGNVRSLLNSYCL